MVNGAREKSPPRSTRRSGGDSAEQTAQLRFLLGFAQRDLGAMRPRDWRAFLADGGPFLRFLEGGRGATVRPGGVMIEGRWPGPPAATRASVQAFQDDARGVLAAIAGGQGGRTTVAVGQLRARWMVLSVRAVPWLHLEGSPRDAGMLRLMLLLASPVLRQLRPCPGCAALFVKVRRQVHCSKRCSDRAAARRRPALTYAARVQRAEQAHARYASRVRRRAGRHAKVARRPRLTAESD